jgi:hypothetical protein
MPNKTTEFICKICGIGFEDSNMLDSHVTETHHPKITVTINDIINGVSEGRIKLKTKGEIVKEIEENKDNSNNQLYNEENLETIEEMSSVQEAARKMKEEFIGSS